MMNWLEPKVYAVKHKNEGIRAASRSGGIFTALSDVFLEEKGVIYGCVLTENFEAVHIRAEDAEVRNRMRGSKYIQSKLGNTYKNVELDLKSGQKVLFSGTSCQVAGLHHFLGQEYIELVCVDIVCHGVPSSAVWRKYLLWQEEKNASRVIAVDFRNKRDFGWHDHVETLMLEDNSMVNSKVFTTLFYGHNILKPSCFECPYKSIMHPGDITIADYWGIEKAVPGFDDNKGVSLVLINSNNGEKIFEKVKSDIVWKPAKIEDSMQPPLVKSFAEPVKRKQFWYDFYNMDFDKIVRKYGGTGLKNRIMNRLRSIKRNLVK